MSTIPPKLQIVGYEVVLPSAVKKHPKNVNEGDFGAIDESVGTNGVASAIIANRRTGHIVDGNHRLDVFLSRGLTDIPVLWIDVDEETELRLLLAFNRTTRLGADDPTALAELLTYLSLNTEQGITGTGFTGDDLDALISEVAGVANSKRPEPEAGGLSENADPDDAPEPGTAAKRAQRGDLWLLGAHRLYVGDSTDEASVRAVLARTANRREVAALVLTDPPYGVAYVGKTKDALLVANDDLGDEGTRELVAAAAQIWPLAPGGSFYVFSPAGNTETAFRLALIDAGHTLRQCLVWVKQQFVLGRQDYHWRHESCLYGWAEGAAHYFVEDRSQDTVLVFDRPTRSREHPTMKPVKMLVKLIENSSKPGDIVFDGFGGSGSTLIACEETGRKCRTIELETDYADVILERWERATGKKAQRLKEGTPPAQPGATEAAPELAQVSPSPATVAAAV